MPAADPTPLFADARAFFAHVVRQSLAGAYPAAELCGRCLYRTADGRRCVAGELIPDEDCPAGINTAGNFRKLCSEYPRLAGYVPPGMTVQDVVEAQLAHDRCVQTVETWDHPLFMMRLRSVPAFAPFFAELDAAAGKV